MTIQNNTSMKTRRTNKQRICSSSFFSVIPSFVRSVFYVYFECYLGIGFLWNDLLQVNEFLASTEPSGHASLSPLFVTSINEVLKDVSESSFTIFSNDVSIRESTSTYFVWISTNDWLGAASICSVASRVTVDAVLLLLFAYPWSNPVAALRCLLCSEGPQNTWSKVMNHYINKQIPDKSARKILGSFTDEMENRMQIDIYVK